MYNGGLSGFLYGQYFSIFKLRVLSRKFYTTLRFACMVILRLTSLKTWWNFFLMLSAVLVPMFLNAVRSSSQLRPMFLLSNLDFSLWRMSSPTNSQTSALS